MLLSTVSKRHELNVRLLLTAKTGYDWGALEKDAVVVDVGGGLGSQSLVIARAHPNLRLVVQDREAVINDAGAVGHPFI